MIQQFLRHCQCESPYVVSHTNQTTSQSQIYMSKQADILAWTVAAVHLQREVTLFLSLSLFRFHSPAFTDYKWKLFSL